MKYEINAYLFYATENTVTHLNLQCNALQSKELNTEAI